MAQLRFIILFCIASGIIFSGCKSTGSSQGQTLIDTVSSEDAMVSARFIDGCKERIIGNNETAKTIFLSIIEKYPQHHASFFQLALIEEAQNNFVDAIEWTKRAIAIDSENKYYSNKLASLFSANHQFEQAARQYKTLIKKYPDQLSHYEQLAGIYTSMGNYSDALKLYDEILETFGLIEEVCRKKYLTAVNAGKSKSAFDALERLVKNFPYEPNYLSYLADFYIDNNQTDKAIEMYQKMIEIDPGNPDAHIGLIDIYFLQNNISLASSELKMIISNPNLNVDAKIKMLLSISDSMNTQSNHIIDIRPLVDTLRWIHPDNPKVLSLFADMLYQDKKFQEALQSYIRVVEIDPSKFVVWNRLLGSALHAFQFDTLMVYGHSALEMYPEQALFYYYTAMGEYFTGAFKKTINTINTALFFVGNNRNLHNRLAVIIASAYLKQGDMKMAEYWLKTLTETERYDPETYMNYHICYDLTERQIERRALIIDHDNNSPLDTIAQFFPFNKDKMKQIPVVDKIVENNRNNFFVCYYAGYLYEAYSFKQKAASCRKQAVKISPAAKVLLSKPDQL